MHKNATKCNKTLIEWCNNKHGASKIIDTFETYHPPTPDVPAPSPVHDDINMEDAGGQFGPMPEVNPTTEATANDIVQSNKTFGSFQGHRADVSAGDSSFWRQRQLEIVELITSQEDASNQLSSRIVAFVERTSTMKKVCIPCRPRVPWRIFIDNPSWCSERNYL
jgi:hypothetical protein